MSDPIVIDPDKGIPPYPWAPVLAFSPPEKWSAELVKWMDPSDPTNLSEFLPKDWASTDLTKIPALIAPPPLFCDAEVHDLYAMKVLRDRYSARIQAEDAIHFDEPFCEMLGHYGVDPDQTLPNGKTAREHLKGLREVVTFDAGCVSLNQKALFNRPRPYQVSPGLHPVIKPPPHAAYPSGHSTQAHTFAWVLEAALGGMAHQHIAERFTDYSTGIARRREIAGLHYSSDTVAGMALAARIVDEYLKGPGKNQFKQVWLDPLRALR